MKYYISCVLCLLSCCAIAQKENDIWVFGDSSGVDFNSGSPVSITSSIQTSGAAAAVCDADGNLLFYATSSKCWDRNGNLMPNGQIYVQEGGWTSYMTSLANGANIVPVLNNPYRYYLFSLDLNWPVADPHIGQLCYSVIDIRLNGGMGDIVPGMKNILIDTGLTAGITFIPGNACNVWMLAHDMHSSAFKAYNITHDGIDTVPVISAVPAAPVPPPGSYYHQAATMSASPDGSMVIFGGGWLWGEPNPWDVQNAQTLFRFDKATGQVSDPIVLWEIGYPDTAYSLYTFSWGAGFSPDNKKLYMNYGDYWTDLSLVYQYDVSDYDEAAILSSQTIINDGYSGGLGYRIYKDKIYFKSGSDGSATLGVINHPNLAGTACQFEPDILTFDGNPAYNGIGVNVVFPKKDTFYHSDTVALCSYEALKTLEAATGPYKYHWDNGSTTASRIVTHAGTYWVSRQDTVSVSDFCNVYIDSFAVITPELDFDLGKDTLLCTGSLPYMLQPGIAGVAYLWQDGSTDDHFEVNDSGTYSVAVSQYGCQASDSIHIAIAPVPHVSVSVTPSIAIGDAYCMGDTIRIEASGGEHYEWFDTSGLLVSNASDTELQLNAGALFTIIGFNAEGCSDTSPVLLPTKVCCADMLMPNAFSPNGDGVNDVFKPVNQEDGRYIIKEFGIYDRWGERVFITYNQGGWDGTFRGKKMPVGTYYYLLKVMCTGGKEQNIKGEVSLVR